jgi:hypothetical protein
MGNFPKLFLLFFLIGGCTVYRSEGRKQFESDSNLKASTNSFSFALQTCINSIDNSQNDFIGEMPQLTDELIYANHRVEAWLSYHNNSVEIKTIQMGELTSQVCTYLFENEEIWASSKQFFLRELEINAIF